ncbi:NAD-dependent epimerase/dehydratase family protein [Achromobacter denitrificans]|uniref:NAD-dependent epimerase/dehydratase family protein n=1 Tax=Achromobacter denitrificans TaxID=32002 RepID=UPI001465AD6E|nr:NAD(P)-dependent oxidoreductase [Achromobacter denitrificans]CAB3811015.1 Uronate dehydrogenase [Achromobacter denitrificans]
MTCFTKPENLRVLITGAAGNIGKCLRDQLRGRYALLRLADIAEQEPAREGEEICAIDVRDMSSVERCMEGIDCVVHLAGIPGVDTWEKILPMNIDGCYNVFEAARRQNVPRVIFASSNHAVGYHRREKFLDNTVEPRPDSLYGVSKVFGETLGRMYADKYGMSVACLRIGTFRTPDHPSEARQLLTWISHKDMAELTRCCIEHESYHFAVAYGVSNNLRNRWDNSNVKFLGYQPQDDSEVFAAEILARNIPEDPIAAQFHGGFYCPLEFVGTTDRIS